MTRRIMSRSQVEVRNERDAVNYPELRFGIIISTFSSSPPNNLFFGASDLFQRSQGFSFDVFFNSLSTHETWMQESSDLAPLIEKKDSSKLKSQMEADRQPMCDDPTLGSHYFYWVINGLRKEERTILPIPTILALQSICGSLLVPSLL